MAEVYDTLTASGTYRNRMSDGEALRELRRVAGAQLDARDVEALATLLNRHGRDAGTPRLGLHDRVETFDRAVQEARSAEAAGGTDA